MSQVATSSRRAWWNVLGHVLRDGGPGYLQFAITNICNARCDFCGFAVDRMDRTARRSVTLEEACRAVDVAAREGIGYLLLVGGEPLVHPDLEAMVRHAAGRGVRPMICSNGSLWTEANMRGFAEAGLSSVIMSIDAPEVAAHESNRGLTGVCRKIRQANEVFAALGIQSTASVTVSRLIRDYERLPSFLEELGFRGCTFSYPLRTLHSSYLSFRDSELVTYATEELIGVFERLKRLKTQARLPVANPRACLTDMQRHLRGEPEQFGCLGGYKYFYLDWNLQLYRCHYWETPICHIDEFDAGKRIRDGCTRCMIDCYRDPSVLQHVAVSLGDAWQALRRGQLRQAARFLCDRRNLVSLRAVWENRRWIGGV